VTLRSGTALMTDLAERSSTRACSSLAVKVNNDDLEIKGASSSDPGRLRSDQTALVAFAFQGLSLLGSSQCADETRRRADAGRRRGGQSRNGRQHVDSRSTPRFGGPAAAPPSSGLLQELGADGMAQRLAVPQTAGLAAMTNPSGGSQAHLRGWGAQPPCCWGCRFQRRATCSSPWWWSVR